MVDTKKKFLLFLESSFINLEILIKEKLKSKGYNFDNDMFKDIVFLLLTIHIVPSTKIIIKKIIFIIIKTGNYNYKNYFFYLNSV